MLVTRTSRLSGIKRTLDLPITDEQVAAFKRGALIQHAFPDLPADKREFILTGITPEEWSATFSDQPEDAA
ncbi:hypothetical protein DK419_13395 [Methylobacterium terrae]|uniref:Uncharacterized protein n=1 Tax=Methylobacterium terrae TaxID=2202827 RepID=A0A2U8WM25_9HYPH|nr:hypothetical protein [Methylobacterium terrae]AWN47189.1 hypothetical protein DK419_13395 [Methylobacterium terrae]